MKQNEITKDMRREWGKMGGRKPGKLTLIKRAELKAVDATKKIIYKKLASMTRAQIRNAMGLSFVYRIDEERDKNGKLLGRKHVLVDDPHEIAMALDAMEDGANGRDGEQYYYITAKEPDTRAYEVLTNRALGKPKETIELEGEVKFSLKGLAEARQELEAEVIDITDLSKEADDTSEKHERRIVPALPDGLKSDLNAPKKRGRPKKTQN